jgi:competence protein ComEC
VVLLGDLEDAGQAALLAETRSRGITGVDVVKVAHHGSRVQSRALAEQLSPAVALVSVGGDNGYGHPTDAALDLYSGVGATVLRTDECGTFALLVRDGELAVGGC